MNRLTRIFARIALAGALLAALGLAAGCSSSKGSDTAFTSTDKVKVAASFYPMADFAQKIGGDNVEVVCLVPAGTEPHDWEPSTTDMRTIAAADVFVYSGSGMESWVEDSLGNLGKDAIAVETSANVTLRGGSASDSDTDPHVWLDPQNAKLQMRAIADALVAADPAHEKEYEANYAYMAGQLDELDAQFSSTLAACPNHTIVVAHEAFGYLCNAYGLTQLGIEGLSADSEPDAARMAQIVDFVRANNVTTIFAEELLSPKVAEAIASETGAQVAILNPIEGLDDEALANGADYFSVMRDNLAALEKALS